MLTAKISHLKTGIASLLYIIGIIAFAQCFGLSIAQADTINKAEDWFNKLTTYKAKFIQVSSDGSHATGQFYLKRPYLSRFDYDGDIPIILITSKSWLHVDETDRREVTSYPVSETPLVLILGDPVRLRDKGIETKSEIRDGVALITLEKLDGEAAGKIVLEFSQGPFELRRWILTDANGITTSVLLTDPQKGIDLSPRLFLPEKYPEQNRN